MLGALRVLADAKAEYDAMDEDDIDQVLQKSVSLKYEEEEEEVHAAQRQISSS